MHHDQCNQVPFAQIFIPLCHMYVYTYSQYIEDERISYYVGSQIILYSFIFNIRRLRSTPYKVLRKKVNEQPFLRQPCNSLIDMWFVGGPGSPALQPATAAGACRSNELCQTLTASNELPTAVVAVAAVVEWSINIITLMAIQIQPLLIIHWMPSTSGIISLPHT